MRGESCFKGGFAAAVMLCGLAAAASAQGPIPINDPPAPASVPGHLAKAAQIAGNNSFASLLAYEGLWCMGPTENRQAVFALAGAKYAMPPEKWFDNLYFIGKPFVGAYILKTSAGLVMWDTLDNAKEAETMLVPGMKQLGLDPKDIKLIILTHGHFDHFGGAKYMQDTYHTPIAESQADWDLMAAYKADGSEAHPYPPAKDRVLADGEDVKVGDATIHILLTPGHSPGTVSSIVPVKDHGKTIMLAMWGGTAYPGTRAALDQMGNSMDKFKAAVAKYNAVGFLNTHPKAFYLRERLAAHDPKARNPLIIGNADMQASVGVMRECLDNMKDWYGAMGKN